MPVRYDKQFGELAYPIPGGIIARGNGAGGTRGEPPVGATAE